MAGRRLDIRLARVMLSEFARERRLRLSDVLRLPPIVLASQCRLPPPAIARLTVQLEWHRRRCRTLRARARHLGAELLAMDDGGYPGAWREHALPPYAYGARDILARPSVAILTSRSVTAATVAATIEIVESAAADGLALVTGGMKSTHRIAAVAARAARSQRVIVLDRGLLATFPDGRSCDPFGFGPRRPQLDLERTLVLSPFRLYDHAIPRNGRRRDELMAALADLVVAISARAGGEIERICLLALHRGRRVLAWQEEGGALVRAGAHSIDRSVLRTGLRRFLPDINGGD
jgi:predicted Rossmann fold nucleotide-binding protein DprA/Smf involved in DNA uptake